MKRVRFGLRVIGAMKLVSGLLLGAAGFGILRLLNADLGAAAERVVARLHLDPENRLVHDVIGRAAGIRRAQLEELGAGTFFYALLHLVEGTGLVLRRRWGEYLTVVATGSLLPLEVYEIARKPRPLRVGVLLVNLGILLYLLWRLWQDRRDRAAEPGPATAGPR